MGKKKQEKKKINGREERRGRIKGNPREGEREKE